MEKKYKSCQSCSMPISKNPSKRGSNDDGTKSLKYCRFCYENGQFTNPNMTADEMQDFVKAKLKQMGYPGFVAGLFTRGIPKLERWEN